MSAEVAAPVGAGTNPALEVQGLSIGYADSVLAAELTFKVESGEIVALMGRNGIGKTTLLKTIAGFVAAKAGLVLVSGAPMRRPAHLRVRQRLGYVSEERSVIRALTVAENLRLGGVSAAAVYQVFPELEPLARRPAGLLSGGEQQMLALGRCLAAGPDILLIDELSFGLAPKVIERLGAALVAASQSGVAVMVVEPQPSIALELASRGLVLGQGGFVLQGTAAELAEDPRLQHAYL